MGYFTQRRKAAERENKKEFKALFFASPKREVFFFTQRRKGEGKCFIKRMETQAGVIWAYFASMLQK